jgi:hypothetical protein
MTERIRAGGDPDSLHTIRINKAAGNALISWATVETT